MILDELLTLVHNGNSEAFYQNVESYLKAFDSETLKSPSKTLLMHLASLAEREKIAFVLQIARNIWFKETFTAHKECQLTIIETDRTQYFRYINAIDEEHTNALIFAARANCLPAVKLLVESGINMYQESRYSKTALEEAALNLNSEMIDFLMLRKPIPKRDPLYAYSSPLKHYCAMTEREKMGANTLVHLARDGCYEAVELLLAYVPVNAINIIRDTALIRASGNNHVKLVELLLKRGADINGTNMFGNAALYEAICTKQNEAAVFLIAQGADISAAWERVEWQTFIAESLEKAGRAVPPLALCEASNALNRYPGAVVTSHPPLPTCLGLTETSRARARNPKT